MTAAFASLAGQRVVELTLHVPPVGPWWADVSLEEDPSVSGRVELVLGGAVLAGTVDPRSSSAFGGYRQVRVIGGAGAWSTELPARSYQNDALVRALDVAQDAAAEVGEQLIAFEPAAQTLGVYYVRSAGSAARALEAAAGGARWWVDYDGQTHVGARSSSTPQVGSYELLDWDRTDRVATLVCDDFDSIVVGTVLPADARLEAAQTVRELRVELSEESFRVLAWCGEAPGARGRIASTLERMIEHVLGRRLFGVSRYRVIAMNGDRVDLQAQATGGLVPDVLAVSMLPGVAGAHASLSPGAEVLVQFVEGDPTQPIITHFAGKDGTGWSPAALTLDATGASASLKLGQNATEAPAWASKLLAELQKIATTFGAAQAPSGGGPVTYGVSGPYVAPASSSSLGAAKTVCE